VYRLAHATQTTATVWVRHTSGGVLTLECNGQTFPGDTLDTGTADGSGTVTATGLSAGRDYPFTVSVGGVQLHAGTLKTAPAAGSTFGLLYAYCFHPGRPAMPILNAMKQHDDIAAFVMGGDNIYADAGPGTGPTTINGETFYNLGAAMQADPTDLAAARSNTRAQYRSNFKMPGIQQAIESFPTYAVISDHDIQAGDNYDASRDHADANDYIVWATTDAEAEAVYDELVDIFHEVYKGHPENTSANRNTNLPTTSQFYYDCVYGDAHCIFLDANTHKVRGSIDYGATQIAWIKEVLSASTATWKIIFTGEATGESRSSLTTDDQEIADYIDAQGITGVVMITGDIHAPAVFEYGFPILRSGQASQDNHVGTQEGYPGETTFKGLGYFSDGVDANAGDRACCYIQIQGSEKLLFEFINQDGDMFWSAEMLPDANALVYPQLRLSA
jgi:phosphodiesterase/alkaline phosphatase D-like protein